VRDPEKLRRCDRADETTVRLPSRFKHVEAAEDAGIIAQDRASQEAGQRGQRGRPRGRLQGSSRGSEPQHHTVVDEAVTDFSRRKNMRQLDQLVRGRFPSSRSNNTT
jgi:hypothetical protein